MSSLSGTLPQERSVPGMNNVPNRQVICETLMAHAETDPDIFVLCSDSRGSAIHSASRNWPK